MRLRKRTYAIAAGVLLIVLAALALGGAILCEGGLRVPATLRLAPDDRIAAELAARTGAQCRPVELPAADGIILRAWLFLPSQPSERGVILLHGVADTRRGVMAHAEYFVRAGYTVLTPDSRAHGSSGGDLMTFGLRERSDVAGWARWMHRETGVRKLYGLGESMGAGILLEAADNFDAVAAECSFATFREIAQYRVAQKARGIRWISALLVDSGFLYAQLRYGLDLERASPLDAVRTTRVPVLLIHGLADRNIPAEQSRELAAANPAVRLWLVPGAGHTEALEAQPAETRARVLGWFSRH